MCALSLGEQVPQARLRSVWPRLVCIVTEVRVSETQSHSTLPKALEKWDRDETNILTITMKQLAGLCINMTKCQFGHSELLIPPTDGACNQGALI